jgi:hypothetical protein
MADDKQGKHEKEDPPGFPIGAAGRGESRDGSTDKSKHAKTDK